MRDLTRRIKQLEAQLDEENKPEKGMEYYLTPTEYARHLELEEIWEYRDHTIDEIGEKRHFMFKVKRAERDAGIVFKYPSNLAELYKAARERKQERDERIKARALTPGQVEKTLAALKAKRTGSIKKNI